MVFVVRLFGWPLMMARAVDASGMSTARVGPNKHDTSAKTCLAVAGGNRTVGMFIFLRPSDFDRTWLPALLMTGTLTLSS